MPTQAQLVFPLLSLAGEAGGAVTSRLAYTELARRHRVADEVARETVVVPCGQRHNLWERHVRFAKERAKAAGYMTSAAPGLWQLTDEGQEAVKRATDAVRIVIVTDCNNAPIGATVELAVGLPTVHTLRRGDARDLSWIPDGAIPLVVTSIPYFDLKEYEHVDGQLADLRSYDHFVDAITDGMRECWRVMMPGGRMAINVGDVLRSRARHGEHEVLPLSADLQVNCRRIGFKSLTGIIWRKLQNCRYEQGGSGVLGQPDQPRRVIKSDCERILLFKKPGDYFHASPEVRAASRISKENQRKWWRDVWDDIPGEKATAEHPAPFPIEVPFRLISMFSFTGPTPQTVLDPFCGRATTTIAAMRANRNSVGVEIAERYWECGVERARAEATRLRSEIRGATT